jgi:hypothetical protein
MVPRTGILEDLEIVHQAFDELFQGNPDLKEQFCQAADDREIKRLLRTTVDDENAVEQLIKTLRDGEMLAHPTRVSNYVDAVAPRLVAQYRYEQAVATEEAVQAAAERRAQERQAAIEASAVKVQTIERKKRWGQPTKLRNHMWDNG